MSQYRKKPVVIEAVEWDGTEKGLEVVLPFIQDGRPDFSHLPKAPDDPHVHNGIGFTPFDGALYIPTLEGTMKANPGDWIIRGIKGEFYPCKPDIFAATYELAAERAGAGEPDWSGVNDRIDADDEIVATGARFHMERMSDEAIWFSINAIPFMLSASKGKLAWIPQESEWENLSLRAKRAAPLRTTEATGEPSIVITDDEQYALDLCDQYLYSTTENSDQADEDTVITDALTNGHLRLIFSLAERFVELAPPSADGASQQ